MHNALRGHVDLGLIWCRKTNHRHFVQRHGQNVHKFMHNKLFDVLMGRDSAWIELEQNIPVRAETFAGAEALSFPEIAELHPNLPLLQFEPLHPQPYSLSDLRLYTTPFMFLLSGCVHVLLFSEPASRAMASEAKVRTSASAESGDFNPRRFISALLSTCSRPV